MKTFIKRMSAFFAVACIVLFSFPSVNAYAALVSEGDVTWDSLMEYQEDYFAILDTKLQDYQGEGNYYIGHIVVRSSYTSGSTETQQIQYISFIIEGGKENFEDYVFGFAFNDHYSWFVSKGPLTYISHYYENSEYNQDLNNRLKGFQNATVDTGTVDYNMEDDVKKYYRYEKFNPYYTDKVEVLYSDVDVIDIDGSSNYTNNSFDYLYHDDRSRVIYESDLREPEYVYDNSIGFSTGAFSARRYFDSHSWGCQNIKVDFSPTVETKNMIHDSGQQWYLDLDMNFNYQLSLGNSGGTVRNEMDSFNITVRVPYDGVRNSAVINLFDAFDIVNLTNADSSTIMNNLRNNSDFYVLLDSYYDVFNVNYSSGGFLDILSMASYKGVNAGDISSFTQNVLNNCANKLGVGNIDSSTFINFDVEITGRFTDGKTRSSIGKAYLNLLDGNNSSYTADVDSSGNEVTQDGYRSDKNEYIVDSSTGDTYYYDYSNHTTENVTTPSLNFSDNIALTHTFANTLALHLDNAAELAPTNNIYVYNQGGSGSDNSDPNVIIEDDDYTDTSLIQHMKDGFEILDNTDTEDKGDGLLSAASFLIAGLSDDYMKLFGFGIASVVTINILRSLFRR